MTPRLLVPLALEALPIRRGAPGAVVERIGMGPMSAERATQRILSRYASPQPMVLLGVAGGLRAEDRPGDVIVATSLMNVDGDTEVRLEDATSAFEHLRAASIHAKQGSIVSSPSIIHGSERRTHAGRNGAVAVDMESFWCAPLAAQHPFVVVRVLLDVPGIEFRSPAMLAAARRAYRSLRTTARAIATWSPVSVIRNLNTEVGEA